jgi:hypothetical protein
VTFLNARQREHAAALLMRELICEKIYRERDKWTAVHPCRALGVRTLPFDVSDYITNDLLTLDAPRLRAYAAEVLDLLEKRR